MSTVIAVFHCESAFVCNQQTHRPCLLAITRDLSIEQHYRGQKYEVTTFEMRMKPGRLRLMRLAILRRRMGHIRQNTNIVHISEQASGILHRCLSKICFDLGVLRKNEIQ